MCITSFAKGVDDEILLEVSAVEEQYGFEVVDLTLIEDEIEEYLEFESMEEFEAFMADFKESMNQDIFVDQQVNPMARINDSITGRWYSPFQLFGLSGVFCWKVVTVDYDFQFLEGSTNRQFVSIHRVTSSCDGLTFANWKQTGYSSNFATTKHKNDTAEIKINGQWTLAVDVGGSPVGLTSSDTWNVFFTLK